MKKRNLFYLPVIALTITAGGLFAACGGGGGSSEPNPTVVQGNIANQVSALRAAPSFYSRLSEMFSIVRTAEAAVSGVRVRIRNTSLETISDDSGFFRLEGDVDGEISIDFEVPGASVTLNIIAPAGSIITLQDIVLNTSTGQATPGQTNVESNDDDDSSSSSSAGSSEDDGDDDDSSSSSSAGSSDNDDDDDDNSSSSSAGSSEDDDDDDDSSSSSSAGSSEDDD